MSQQYSYIRVKSDTKKKWDKLKIKAEGFQKEELTHDQFVEKLITHLENKMEGIFHVEKN